MDRYEAALKPEKYDTSYVRVYKLLMKTPRGLEIRQRVEAAYEAVTFHQHSFVLNGTNAVMRFEFCFGKRSWSQDEGDGLLSLSPYNLTAEAIVSREELEQIVHSYFGKPRTGYDKVEHAVPTFNCSPDTVLGIRKIVKNSKGKEKEVKPKNDAETFASWALGLLNRWEFRSKTLDRLKAEMQAVLSGPEIPAARKAALVELAKEDLTKVLVKWQSCLPTDDIEAAWNLAKITVVMEA